MIRVDMSFPQCPFMYFLQITRSLLSSSLCIVSRQLLCTISMSFLWLSLNHLYGNTFVYISSVGSRNFVTLIFTKMTFCQRGNTKRMAHILSNYRCSRPIRTPLKSINHVSKYRIYEKKSIILVLILLRYEALP